MSFLKRAKPADNIRSYGNLFLAISQIVIPILPLFGIGNFVGGQPEATQIPITPATYAFSIWSVIFTASLIYAICQIIPRHKTNELFRRIGWYTLGAFAMTSLWMIVTQFFSFVVLTALIIVVLLVFAILALFELTQIRPNSKNKWAYSISSITTGLLAGWATAATPVNILSVFDWSGIIIGNVFLILGTLTAFFVLKKSRGNDFYALAFLWGVAAIMVRQVQNNNLTILLVSTIAFALTSAFWLINRRNP